MTDAVTISIVTYNSAAVIARCLSSIPEGMQVIVVDNASVDDGCAIIAAQFPHVQLMQNEQNIGFGAAHNRAVQQAKTPYVFLLNPDAALMEGCVESLLHAAERYDDAAIVAPLLLDAYYQPQKNSPNRSVFNRRRKGRHSPAPAEGPICAEFLSGAALLVDVRRFLAIGGFDEALFLFYEDDDLCLQAREHGYSCVLVPDARVFHAAGQSSPTRSWAQVRQKYRPMAQSEMMFHQKYRGQRASLCHAVKRLMVCTSKAVLYTLMGKRFKAQKYAAQWLGIVAFLKDGG